MRVSLCLLPMFLFACADGDGDGAPDAVDCNPTDPAVYPGAAEVCDGADQDCDGQPDNGLQTTWYLDADGDGAGDPGVTMTGCAPVSPFVADSTDCDDLSAAVYPGAAEPDCTDPVDYNCDGSVAYADVDADGFAACVDCDDADATASPGGVEIAYDGVDQDCDGADLCDVDADGFDDLACGGGDCDDADAAIFPGAVEDVGGAGVGNGIDDDCDGLVDEGLPYGNGQAGPLYVTVDSTFADIGGGCTPVSLIGADTVEVADSSVFAPGDKALLLTVQYDRTVATAVEVGAWELLDVAGVGTDDVTFASPITRTYGDGSNAALTGVSVALYRVPQFHGLGVAPDVSLRADAWDGTCGGVLAVVSDSYLSVRGTIEAVGAGYRGGAATRASTEAELTGWQGEGPAGLGDRSPAQSSGGGGGGGLIGSCPNCEGNAGGGAHGGSGGDGSVINPDFGGPGAGGLAYGDQTLATLTMGSGGGSGAIDRLVEDGTSGAGGAGGGILFLAAPRTYIPGLVDASGADGSEPCAGPAMQGCTANQTQPTDMSEAGSGGGGAGGTVYLITDELSLYFPNLVAVGGQGAEALSTTGFFAGDGGDGLVRLDTASVNGWDFVDPLHAVDAMTYCEPDPFLFDLDP